MLIGLTWVYHSNRGVYQLHTDPLKLQHGLLLALRTGSALASEKQGGDEL